MDLPSFLWLWRIAAWSMGLTIFLYGLLLLLGLGIMRIRLKEMTPPFGLTRHQIRLIHQSLGMLMVGSVLLLLAIGIVGTLGHYGHLGHSWHWIAGIIVVGLTLLSAHSGSQAGRGSLWFREIHVVVNGLLFGALAWVSITGWWVVQKYLPHQ